MSKIEKDYRRHIWMVQSRDSQFAIEEKISDGVPELIEREWTDCLKAPVWGNRAVWHANNIEGKWKQARIVKVQGA
jgi:hypothetical protein